MSVRVCAVLTPRKRSIIGSRDDGYLPECILPDAHDSFHVICTPEGEYFTGKTIGSVIVVSPKKTIGVMPSRTN